MFQGMHVSPTKAGQHIEAWSTYRWTNRWRTDRQWRCDSYVSACLCKATQQYPDRKCTKPKNWWNHNKNVNGYKIPCNKCKIFAHWEIISSNWNLHKFSVKENKHIKGTMNFKEQNHVFCPNEKPVSLWRYRRY